MSAPVTLILASSLLGHQTALKAKEQGHIVVLGSTKTDPSFPSTKLNLHDHESFTSLFDSTLSQHKHVDNLILAFVPPQAEKRPEGYIAGTDHSAVDDVIQPVMKGTKVGFYHFRRSPRAGKAKMVIFAEKGHDTESSTSFNAVLGLFRSIVPKSKCIGINIELVTGDISEKGSMDAITSALLAPANKKPSVHIIDNGKTTTQAFEVGQCSSSAIQALGGRMIPLIWLGEKATALNISTRRILHPPRTASTATQLAAALARLIPTAFLAFTAVSAYFGNRPFLAFVLSFLASRISSAAGGVLLIFTASRAILGRKMQL